MLYDLQRVSKGLIIYSALISDFERLDFKNDALAGVRANFFNSNHNPQSDKTDMQGYSLSYTMRWGEPLLWKVSANNQPYQKVRRVSDEVYCVLTYNENGVVSKRIYFDNYHSWLCTEYFDRERENLMLASVKPVNIDGVVCIRYDRPQPDGKKSTEYLYPTLGRQNKKCACLIYTNCGMIRFDASFKPEGISDMSEKTDEKGFDFTVEDFSKPAVKPLDLQNAAFLSESDYEEEQPEEPKAESGAYSAYDRIESILFEAHKTNKNIFGEVVAQAAETETEPEAEPEPEPEPEASPEPEQPEKPEYEAKEKEQPDSLTETEKGVYSYYGKLDENGMRTGFGRTESPDGMTVYSGSYDLDKRDGFGISYYRDGKPNYAGNWMNGSRNGCGVGYRHSDGTMHVGNWTDNTPDGIGARFGSQGEFLDVCRYSMGEREGKAVKIDKNGNVVITVYVAGEPVAEKVITDEDLFPQRDVASNP